MGKKFISLEDTLIIFKEVHRNNYDYSLITKENFKGIHCKVPIRCIKHDSIFEMEVISHKKGRRLKCCWIEADIEKKKYTFEEFLEKTHMVHNNLYKYDNFIFIDMLTKGFITCNIHGDFPMTPNNHINHKQKCPDCQEIKTGLKRRITNEEFLTRAKEIHGNEFEYLEPYQRNDIFILAKHRRCGKEFKLKPHTHLNVNNPTGCTKCNKTKGQIKLELILEKYNIEYSSEFRFKDCKNKNPLPFDIYIKSKDTCIEYQGRDHYPATEKMLLTNPSRYNENNLKSVLFRDNIKAEYCKNKNIKLIIISYLEFYNIEEILKRESIITN